VSWGGMSSLRERNVIERELNFGVFIRMARLDQEQEVVDGDDNEDEEMEKWSSTSGSYV